MVRWEIGTHLLVIYNDCAFLLRVQAEKLDGVFF